MSVPSARLVVRIIAPLIIALLLIFVATVSLHAPVSWAAPIDSPNLAAQSVSVNSLSGWFMVIWADGEPGTHLSFEEYWLTIDDGKMVRLQIDPALLESLGGSERLNGQRVQVQGAWLDDGSWQVKTLELIRSTSGPLALHKPDVTGSLPWITIPCKFSDIVTETRPISYFTQMYTSTYPGLDHYWREQSYNLANVQGSGSVSHWYTLPQPHGYYQVAGGGMDTGKLFADCTAAADTEVYFPNYVGINMMFNGYFPSSKGGYGTATLDGVTRTWYRTWQANWGIVDVVVVEHEMGHGFGLPHSSGNYGETYDNAWDVMSDGWANCNRLRDPVYGCLGQHTIGWHKDKEGWIAANKKATITAGSQATITLERTALPQTNNALIVQIPVKGSADRFYTLEARRNAGYDVKLLYEGVIIHYVETNRTNPARVIDIDNNGETNDAGAIWLPGEVFSDTTNGITVTIVSSTATGYVVKVENQSYPNRYYVAPTGSDSANTCTNSAAPCATTQHAVDVADADGEIRLAAGTYTGVSTRAGLTQMVYLSKTVKLLGGYTTANWNTAYPLTQTSTLNAQGQGRVIYVADGSPLIQGLRLTRGDTTPLSAQETDGGGVYLDYGTSATIRNCQIDNNNADNGGGVFVQQNNVTLEGNTIVSNSAIFGGGVMTVFDAGLLSGNVFRANEAYQGGALYLYDSEARLINNVIADNSASGQGSGVYAAYGTPQLWHTTVARNTGSAGSGLYLYNSTASLVNTILVGHAIGINASTGSTAILTATLWGSGAWANTTDWTGNISIGSVNVHGDPGFKSSATGDYHLTATSAAIDQGVATDIITDIDNEARPNSSAPDLGADEWYKSINHAPSAPTLLSPSNGATNVWVLQPLSWQGGDPDGDLVTYTVALGSSNPPSAVGQTTLMQFNPSQLLTSTHYYWKITATDGLSVTIGPLWDFTTRNNAITYRLYLPLIRR